MLWPDDPVWRGLAYNSANVEHLQDAETVLVEELRWRFALARQAFPIDVVCEAAQDRFKRAWLAGQLLHDAVGCISLGFTDLTLEDHISRIIDPVWVKRNGGRLRISVKTFQNQTWPTLRCVAHLWASAFTAMRFQWQPFPCHVARLRDFLADAEAYRIMGERSRIKKLPSTVLNPNETIKLPPGLVVEPSVFSFEKNDVA